MRYLFGNIMTRYAPASLNRGESDGNEQYIQQIIWHQAPHTTVSPFSIRWQVRHRFQEQGEKVYEIWDERKGVRLLRGGDRDPQEYIDDDAMGYMTTQAAKKNLKGTTQARRGALGTGRAISLNHYDGARFNYYSSRVKDNLSVHTTNVHNTWYQYCFGLDSRHLVNRERIFNVIDAFTYLGQVGGHYNDSLYDFSPESLILRWTLDNCPRFLYCFELDKSHKAIAPQLVEQVEAGDIKPEELWIGGEITKRLKIDGAKSFRGVIATAEDLKRAIALDFQSGGN